MYRVTAWEFTSHEFSGYIYTLGVLQSKMNQIEEWTVRQVFLYRDHEPMPHMTYVKVK